MADVLCRVCGEPWDCTGGLTYLYDSMSWWEVEQLKLGVGCPACAGEAAHELDSDDAFLHRWQSGWSYACEGEYPYASFPDRVQESEWPKWYKGVYRDDRDPPSLYDVIDLSDLGCIEKDRVVLCGDHSGGFQRDQLGGASVRIFVTGFAKDYASSCRFAELLLRANHAALREGMSRSGFLFEGGLDGFSVCVGEVNRGRVTIDTGTVEYIDGWERALLHYPVVDDLLWGRMELEEGGDDDGAG